MTKEEVYRTQMEGLGIYDPIFDPEIRTLCRIEREYTRAQKAWSATAPPGGKPSFLDEHYPVLQKLRAEILQHREALGLTPKALRKLTGFQGTQDADQQDQITARLDQIAARVAGYDGGGIRIAPDAYEGIPDADEASAIGEALDQELAAAIAEDMG